MKTLLLLSVLGLSLSTVIKQPMFKIESLRAKLIKEGTFDEFLAQQHLARASNAAVGAQPFIDIADDLYLGDIGLGTPYQNFSVVLSTGSSTLWVVDADCATRECRGTTKQRKQFDTTKSSTVVKTDQPFVLFYGEGYTSGYIAEDVLDLAGLIVPSQGFGVATQVAGIFAQQPVDGILGLAWPTLAVQGVDPPMQNLLDQLDQPLFTVWLDRNVLPGEAKLGGLITYGGLDAKHCDAQVDYVPLTAQTYWQFGTSGFSLGDYSYGVAAQAISDTGVARIGGPVTAVAGAVKALGAKFDWTHEMYTVACDGVYPDMMFTIGGRAYNVPSTDYVVDVNLGQGRCSLALFEEQGGGFGPTWILGNAWIRAYCQIYDVGHARIGFAKARHSK